MDAEIRDSIIEALNENGIGASGSYPKSILDVLEVKNICNLAESKADMGRRVANEIITLPTHFYVQDKHIDKIFNTFKQFLI